jgi:hypothetical protein
MVLVEITRDKVNDELGGHPTLHLQLFQQKGS